MSSLGYLHFKDGDFEETTTSINRPFEEPFYLHGRNTTRWYLIKEKEVYPLKLEQVPKEYLAMMLLLT